MADFCIVDVVEKDGEIRRLKVVCRDPEKNWICDAFMRVPLDRMHSVLLWSVLETRRAILVERVSPETVKSLAQSEEHLRLLRAVGPESVMSVPLLVQGKVLGVIALVSSVPSHSYGPDDLRLAEELARRAALSIENARLYLAARRAIQARDEVLGIIAHDLRSPLGTILMQAALLRRLGPEPERRSCTPVERLERAANRMNRLIQDLLDVRRWTHSKSPAHIG